MSTATTRPHPRARTRRPHPGAAARVPDAVGGRCCLGLLALLFLGPAAVDAHARRSRRTTPRSSQPDLTFLPRTRPPRATAPSSTPRRPRSLRWFLNSMLAATGQTLLVLVVASMARLRPGPDGVPGQEAPHRPDPRDPVRAADLAAHPQLRASWSQLGWLDSLTAVIVPGRGRRVRRLLPAAVLPVAAAGAGGGGHARRRQPVADLLQGHPAAVQAGPGHPRPAHVPRATGTTSCGRSTCCSAPSG